MIIPSIDLQDGNAVQLVGGDELEIDAGDPRPIMEQFRLAGEVAVIDLDAAMGEGSNASVIEELVEMGDCRVGGGIRDVETAIEWLNKGASRVILGTAAKPEILRHLPSDRVVAALDAVDGEVVVEGWKKKTGETVADRMEELSGLVDAFMVTFVEKEGRLEGTKLEAVERLCEIAGDADLTVAGGVSTVDEIAALHELGVDAQVGMAIYKDQMHLADAIAAPLESDRDDGLWPTVICDVHEKALGLAYSDLESLREAVDRQRGAYHSRSRGLWVKGETSGAVQHLRRIDLDCDADALRFIVEQEGEGFCHRDTRTCWGEDRGLTRLERIVRGRLENAPEGSYTKMLFEDPELLREKLVEEANELAEAHPADHVVWETADLLYFTFVAMVAGGASLSEVEGELTRRMGEVKRRDAESEEGDS